MCTSFNFWFLVFGGEQSEPSGAVWTHLLDFVLS
jgi:hypothetical protein